MQHDLAGAPFEHPIVIQYHRLSREEQIEGHGLERQRTGSEAWCGRHSLEADLRLEDVGFSAFTADNIRRGRLGQLIDAVEDGRVPPGSTLVLENLDRFSRQDPLQANHLFTGVLLKGVAIVTTSDGFRYARDGSGLEKLMAVFLSAMHFGRGHSESELKSTRVGISWEKKRRAARESKAPHGRRCPAWIELRSDGYHLIRKRADLVKWICERAIDGWGRRKIVAKLIADKTPVWAEPTVKRPQPVWQESYIAKILTSGEACGTYTPSRSPKHGARSREEPIEDYYPAAVDRATFQRARAAAVSRRGGGGRSGSFKNLFRNICVCGAPGCGRGMTIEDKGERSNGAKLVCTRATVRDCEHSFRYDYALAEISIMFGIGKHADDLVRTSRSQADEIRGKLTDEEAFHRDVLERIKRLVKRMEENDDPALDEALRERRAEARLSADRIAGLKHDLVGAMNVSGPSSPHSMMAFYERLMAVPAAERPAARNKINQALRSTVERIVFLDGKLRVEFVDGGTAWADVSAKRSNRPNPGQFSSVRKNGRQVRRGDLSAGEPR